MWQSQVARGQVRGRRAGPEGAVVEVAERLVDEVAPGDGSVAANADDALTGAAAPAEALVCCRRPGRWCSQASC